MINRVYKEINVGDLEIDVDNPRIAHWLEMYKDGEITAEAIHMALGAGGGDSSSAQNGTSFMSLRESIRSNEGVIHPIIVNRTDKGNIVIEGNTRVMIYKEFIDNNTPGNWQTIPAIVYENLPPSQIDAIRLQAHLVGPRDWTPYAKAKYLDKLRNQDQLPFARIVDFCGGREKEVSRYIDAYIDMEKHYRPLCGDSFDPSRFSAFVELQAPAIQAALTQHKVTKDIFAGWIKDRKIGRLEKIRSLPSVLNNPIAKKVFIDKNIDEAIKVLDTPNSQKGLGDANIYELAKELSRRISSIPMQDVQAIKNDNGTPEYEVLMSVIDNVNLLAEWISPEE